MTFFQPNYLPDADKWGSWALNEIPWLQCQDPQFHQPLPRLSAWFNTDPDGLAPMPDRLLELTHQLSEYLWLDLTECSPMLLRDNDQKLGWKELDQERAIVFLMGDRKVMVKDENGDRVDHHPQPGSLLVLPPNYSFSVPRTSKFKNPSIFLTFY